MSAASTCITTCGASACCPVSARSPSAARSGTGRHPAAAISYGTGLALIVDEFALLLDLRDVYWAKQGRISIDIGVGGIAVAGSYFAALPVLGRLERERKQRALAREAPAPEAVPDPRAGYSST